MIYCGQSAIICDTEKEMETKADADIINRIRMRFMLREDGERHVREYLQAVEEIRTDDDNLSLEQKLGRLLSPLLEMIHADSPKFNNYVQVVDEEYIDLKNEIDTESLHYEDEKYSIDNPINTGDQWLLETNIPAISLSDKYEGYLTYCRDIEPVSEADFEDIYKNTVIVTHIEDSRWKNIPASLFDPLTKLTLKEVQELWLSSLTEKSIAVQDLLQQVLVCYTIKRAQNGHEGSARKLFSLFEDRVKLEFDEEGRIAINKHTVRNIKRLIGSTLHADLEGIDSYDRDIIGAARGYLWLILTGFNPRQIVDGIMKENENYPVPKKIKDFYLKYFSEEVPNELLETTRELYRYEVIFFLCDGLIRQLKGRSDKISDADERLKKLENVKRQIEWTINDLGLTVDTLLNPYHPIMEGYWLDGKGKARWFNNYCYRPNKRGNLTVWLFGPKGNPEYGKVHQLVRDELYEKIGKDIMTDSADARVSDQAENGEQKGEHTFQRRPSNDDITDIMQTLEHRDLVARASDYLAHEEFSGRDIKIFFDRILYDASADDLERKHGVSARQQQKIVKKIEDALKKAVR